MYKCPKCDEPFEIGIKFCTKCGCNIESLFIENPICPICHEQYSAGTIYCIKDGSKLVSPEKLTPKCVICGTQYPEDIKFCPKDGGVVIPEALRYTNHLHKTNGVCLQKANLGKRFVANLLDSLITIGLCIPTAIFCVIGVLCIPDYQDPGAISVLFFFLAAFAYCIPIIYVFIKDGMGEGQSWGKKAMKIKVVNINDHTNCTKKASALRALVNYALSLIPIIGWLIEPIMVLATSNGRRLADKAAETMVINANI